MLRAFAAGCRTIVFVVRLDERSTHTDADWTCAGRGIVTKGRSGHHAFGQLVQKLEGYDG